MRDHDHESFERGLPERGRDRGATSRDRLDRIAENVVLVFVNATIGLGSVRGAKSLIGRRQFQFFGVITPMVGLDLACGLRKTPGVRESQPFFEGLHLDNDFLPRKGGGRGGDRFPRSAREEYEENEEEKNESWRFLARQL